MSVDPVQPDSGAWALHGLDAILNAHLPRDSDVHARGHHHLDVLRARLAEVEAQRDELVEALQKQIRYEQTHWEPRLKAARQRVAALEAVALDALDDPALDSLAAQPSGGDAERDAG